MNCSSPTLREMELTMHLPWRHSRPAMQMWNLDESMTTGILAISGSVAMRLQNLRMQSTPSSMPSSKFTSRICAPFSTCFCATSAALAQSPAMMVFLKRIEPATLQRSPMFWNTESSLTTMSSSPERRMKFSAAGRPPQPGGRRVGVRSETASAMHLMWSGVVPQHPPIMLTRPSMAHWRRTGAICSPLRSYPPMALGRPALG
mmetsp:Transcript_30668/g.77283  ORF Transcript_30668/g.77283 Transcript_30668/m.77283 type:complete len:203 (-) Transcript_30668:900-1508(-)